MSGVVNLTRRTGVEESSRAATAVGSRQNHKENAMPAHSYKHIEVTGSSTVGIDDAISTAVAKAGKTLHGLHWFEVIDTRGYIEDNKVKHWQVTVKIGFRLED